MANDISISVRVADNTAAGLTAVNRSLRNLRTNATSAGQGLNALTARAAATTAALRALHDAAEDANRSLRTLRGRAAATAAAMGDLRDRSTLTNNALRTLNARADTGANRLGALSDRTRALRSDMDDLDGSMTRVVTNMNGLRGRLGTISTAASRSGEGMDGMRSAALLLAPAILPIAAAAVPVVASVAAATTALVAFGAALIPQAKAMGEASAAEKKYNDAVKEHGKGSAEAAKAEAAYMQRVKQLPPATREAAAALSSMKDQYKAWAESLSGDTMPVATKSFAVFSGLFPKLTPLVRSASEELNQMMTLLAGGINSSGFDRLMGTFSAFTSGVLRSATDGLIHLTRVLSQGGMSGGALSEFMAYARENGPLVAESLANIGRAVTSLLAAASDAGVGLLEIVNGMAKLVDAVPTELLSSLLQLVLVFKAVKMAAAGLAAVSGIVAAFGAQITAMRAAAAGASGGLTTLTAAFGALSRGAKVALVASGIGLLVVALTQLSEMGRRTPPDIDRMTTAMGKLGESGKVSGEAAKAFGKDLGGLADSLRVLARPSNMEGLQQFMTSLIGMDSTPVEEAKQDINAVDEALANLVKGGNADLAEAAFQRAAAAMKKKGLTAQELRGQLDGYKSALADAAFAEQLAAQGMGLFGQQALATSEKLNAQKGSADGLRQAIVALNDVHRQGLGGMIAFEAAIDTAAKAARDNAGSLSMTGGQLDLNSAKARDAATALQDLASRTDEAAAAARESGGSWESVNAIYERGRSKLIANAQAMGLTKSEARALAAQILATPDKTARLKGNLEDLEAKLASAKGQLARVPDSRRAAIRAQIAQLQAAVASARAALNSVRDKTVFINTYHRDYVSVIRTEQFAPRVDGVPLMRASGGPVSGPGTGTSDDVPLMASDGEYVVQKASVDKYGLPFLDAINAGTLRAFAGGGRVTKAMREARSQAAGDLTVSYWGRRAGRRQDEFVGALGDPNSLGDLAQSLNKWRGIIKAATDGGVEKRLLSSLDRAGMQLIKHEKQLTKVNSALESARDKLNGLRDKFNQAKEQVSSGIMSQASITGAAQSGKRLTLDAVMGDMTANRDKAVALAGALKTLRARGLNSGSLQEIANGGIDGGLATAEALMRASSGDIKRINQMRGQIASAAGSAGTTTADAMYGAGIKAAEGLVRGLERQQAAIERVMIRIAEALERQIKKAFGVKANGGPVGAAGGGPRSAMTWVGEQGPELVRLPYGSSVRTAGDSRRLAAAAGGGDPVVLEITSGGSRVDDLLVELLRGAIRVRGGNVQAVLGRAGA
ncbi:phage tail protein [Streptomyces sp. NPDC053048]|uniref:phage tail protein n=1 Tax=Streptomyces sp. NPDC053048 TaxID=3365694 RepID=UPI0037D65BE3